MCHKHWAIFTQLLSAVWVLHSNSNIRFPNDFPIKCCLVWHMFVRKKAKLSESREDAGLKDNERQSSTLPQPDWQDYQLHVWVWLILIVSPQCQALFSEPGGQQSPLVPNALVNTWSQKYSLSPLPPHLHLFSEHCKKQLLLDSKGCHHKTFEIIEGDFVCA